MNKKSSPDHPEGYIFFHNRKGIRVFESEFAMGSTVPVSHKMTFLERFIEELKQRWLWFKLNRRLRKAWKASSSKK